MTAVDLLVVGDCNPDVVVRGDDLAPRFGQQELLVEAIGLTIGGSATITACAAARLGLRVALVSLVGRDAFGDVLLELVAQRGVDIAHVRRSAQLPTGCTVVLSAPADRAMLTASGTIAHLTADMVDRDVLRAARHVHVASYFLQTGLQGGLADLLVEARAGGASVSIDPNWDPSGSWDGGLGELLALTDVLLPNAEEARLLARRDALEDAARTLGRRAGEVVVKRGSDGALAVYGDELVSVPAPAVHVVDTTGAGDTFDAGYLAARLNGWDMERRLRFAAACGALATTGAGGTAAQPDAAAALALSDRDAR